MKNEYVCVEIENSDEFIERIEALESRGFATVSAGHAEKGVWYAILRKSADAQQTPKDEMPELLGALRKIKEFCGRNACADCSFGWDKGSYCEPCSSAPEYWRLEGRDGNA